MEISISVEGQKGLLGQNGNVLPVKLKILVMLDFFALIISLLENQPMN